MANVQWIVNGETCERGFDSYRKARKFYNELVSKYAPAAARKTACWDVDSKPENVIRLMRGRFVKEYVTF